MTRRLLLGAVLLTAVPAWADDSALKQPGALLDPNPQERSGELYLAVGFPWFYGIGIATGARYSIPIVKNGFIPKLNNSFEVEFGALFGYIAQPYSGYEYTWFFIGTGVNVRWTFYLIPKLAVYGALGIGIAYVDSGYVEGEGYPCPGGIYCSGVLPQFFGGVGIIYHFAKKLALRAEISDLGINGGIGIDLF